MNSNLEKQHRLDSLPLGLCPIPGLPHGAADASKKRPGRGSAKESGPAGSRTAGALVRIPPGAYSSRLRGWGQREATVPSSEESR